MKKIALFYMVLIALLIAVHAEENITDNSTVENLSLITTPEPTPTPEASPSPTPTPTEEANITPVQATPPPSASPTLPPSPTEPPKVTDYAMTKFAPTSVDKGDVLFNVEINNTGTVALENLVPVIVARGFSTYDSIPIQKLEPGEKDTAIISGAISSEGNILVTVKVGNKVFYQTITVQATKPADETNKVDTETKLALTQELADVKAQYLALEKELSEKSEKYDTGTVNLDSLKNYVMEAQTNLYSDDLIKANVTLLNAKTELDDQKNKLENSQKKPFLDKLKDNILIISAIAGALLTIFSFYEILRQKQKNIVQKIHEVKITKETKVFLKPKKKGKKESSQ